MVDTEASIIQNLSRLAGLPTNNSDIMREAYLKGEKALNSPERASAINRIFGPDAHSFLFPEGKGSKAIFNGFCQYIFDPGTDRDASLAIPGLGDFSEKAAPIHSRASFIAESLKAHKKGLPITLGLVDLKDFRDTDFKVGSEKMKPADVIANKVSRKLRTAVNNAIEALKTQKMINDNSAYSYEVGRYGGDEFAIGLYGQQLSSEEVKSFIMNAVRKELHKQDDDSPNAYYKKNKNALITAGAIKLKGDPSKNEDVEWVTISENPQEKEIFMGFLERGLILPEKEFDRVKNIYRTENGQYDMDKYKKDYPPNSGLPYPETIHSLEDKIAFITKNHPEFIPYFGLAKYMDKGVTTERQEFILSTLESSVFDRLLGDMIYSRGHFIDHIQRQEIKDVYIIDFKFPKEINTALTFSDTDQILKSLWGKIKDALGEEDRQNVIVSRFSGCFYIGVKKGKKLNNFKQLAEIKDMTLFSDSETKNYTIPLGTHYSPSKKPSKKYQASEFIQFAEEKALESFYVRLIEDIEKEEQQGQFIESMKQATFDKFSNQMETYISKAQLYTLNLKGKRSLSRIESLESTINNARLNKLRENIRQSGKGRAEQVHRDIKQKQKEDPISNLLLKFLHSDKVIEI